MEYKKTLIIILLISFGFLISCTESKNEDIEIFEFAIYDNVPLFVDEYLYTKETRNGIRLVSDQTEWYLIDWNNDGTFDEIGIDYYGVKSPFKRKPILAILKEQNVFNHNAKSYSIEKETRFREIIETELHPKNEISYISDFIPIILADGKILNSDILNNFDKTVIYFWATWCAPCVKKLEQVERLKNQLSDKRINFIPINYKSGLGSVLELNEKKNISFEPIEISERSALEYQVLALPETYVFDRNGKLIAEEFRIE